MSPTKEKPIYASEKSLRNLWQTYRIYPDRLELKTWIGFRTMVIPLDQIVEIEERPAVVIGDLFRGKRWAYSMALKLDLADLFQHVSIQRSSGWFKYVRITPNDPELFVKRCKSVLAKSDNEQ